MYFLLTDIFFLGMLIFCLLISINSLRHRANREICSYLLSKPIAVSSGLILLFFLIIAALDSIHFYPSDPSQASMTVIDRILSPLDKVEEKTYSAPFALRLYTLETEMVQGQIRQIFPRLVYPEKIKDEQIRKQIIITNLQSAGIQTLFFLGTMFIFYCLYQQYFLKRKLTLRPCKMELTIFFTVFFLLFLSISCYQLSRHVHIFGTGKIGQDIFYYTVKSIRTGLVIGMVTTLVMLPLGIILGISAGYFGGWIDDLIQFTYTVLSSIPGVLLITASVLSLQTYIANHPQLFVGLESSADARLLALCFILGVTSWTSLCRLLRAESLKYREMDFVQAAKALGSGTLYILRKHLLPNMLPLVLITMILDFSFLILAEAVLSYVGVGVSPLTISWGNMINGARLELARDPIVWWPIFAAFIFMFALVLASNLFADALRDAMDPHHS